MLLFSYKVFKFTFRYLVPAPVRYPLVRWIAERICRFNPARRKVIVENLTPLVGARGAAKLAPELLGNFLMTAVDFFCTRPQLSRDLILDGWPEVEAAYKQNQRVMIVTAHFGNWEIGISYVVEMKYPVTSLYATYTDDAIVQWIMSHRNPKVEWIPTEPGAADSCVASMEKGRMLCLAADIPFGEHGRRVTVAGHPARLPIGPWAIAVRAKATVFPAFVLRRSPGRYHALIHEPIKPPAGLSPKQQMLKMQDTYRAHLERYLKTHPEQWGNLQPFWDNHSS